MANIDELDSNSKILLHTTMVHIPTISISLAISLNSAALQRRVTNTITSIIHSSLADEPNVHSLQRLRRSHISHLQCSGNLLCRPNYSEIVCTSIVAHLKCAERLILLRARLFSSGPEVCRLSSIMRLPSRRRSVVVFGPPFAK